MPERDFMYVPTSVGNLKMTFLNFSNARVAPQVTAVPHSHINYELHCIESGSCLFTVGETDYTVKAGDILIIPPQEYHGFLRGAPSADFSKYTFFFSPDRPTDADEEASARAFAEFAVQNRHIKSASASIPEFCRRLNGEATSDRADSVFVRSALYSLIMLEVLRAKPILPQLFKRAPVRNASFSKEVVDEFFNRNYQSNTKVQDLADYLNFSVRYTNTILNRLYGMSFTQKLYHTRLSAAKPLLIYTNDPIAQICYDCGFQSHSFFNSLFRKHYGTTPSEFRRVEQRRRENGATK